MEFAITAGSPADNSYRSEFLFVGERVKDFLAISLAAVLGANLRYILSRLAAREFGPIFPYGTLIINVLGSFIVGLFVIWTTERVLVDPRWRLLVSSASVDRLPLFPAMRLRRCPFSNRASGV
jgi:Integral membrane protein possibly involved in chromosome condensation